MLKENTSLYNNHVCLYVLSVPLLRETSGVAGGCVSQEMAQLLKKGTSSFKKMGFGKVLVMFMHLQKT